MQSTSRVKRIKLIQDDKAIGGSHDLAIVNWRGLEIRKKVIGLEKVALKDNSLNINGKANLEIAIKLEAAGWRSSELKI